MEALLKISIESEKLKIDSVKKILYQTPIGIGISVLNSVILVVILISLTSGFRLAVWLTAVLLVNIIRISIQCGLNKKEITNDKGAALSKQSK